MKKAYLAISYANRNLFNKEVEVLSSLLKKNNYETQVFVDNYNFKPDEENKMMKTAFKEIDSSDILIAELTTKSIGVGIEIGYAYAKEKPILYLRKKGAEYSTTAAGSSGFIIEYENENDLSRSFQKVLQELKL